MFVLRVPSDVLLEVLLLTCIITTFGIDHTDTTFRSIWCVAEAANTHPNLDIAYPEDHNAQRPLLKAF
jgi:hypothetical protein